MIKDRYEIREPIDNKELYNIAEDKNIKILQISEGISKTSWKAIAKIIIANRPDISIRLFHFIKDICDLSVLELISDVEKLTIDCVDEVKNIQCLSSLKKLKSFSVGIYNLESFECLNNIPQNLEELYLDQTKSKKPDLNVLEKFENLKVLSVVGHTKNIHTISKLINLRALNFRTVKAENLDFLKGLNKLQVLDVRQGSVKDVSVLKELKQLKYLELWQVRGIEDVDFISYMIDLETLFLQSLNKVNSLPCFNNLNSLKKLYLKKMNHLSNFENLSTLTTLEELYILEAKQQSPEDYFILLENAPIRSAKGNFENKKKNKVFEDKLEELGIRLEIKQIVKS